MAKKQRVYTAEFKQEAVRLMETSGKVLLSLRVIWVFQTARSIVGEKACLSMESKHLLEKGIKQNLKEKSVAWNASMRSCAKSVTS